MAPPRNVLVAVDDSDDAQAAFIWALAHVVQVGGGSASSRVTRLHARPMRAHPLDQAAWSGGGHVPCSQKTACTSCTTLRRIQRQPVTVACRGRTTLMKPPPTGDTQRCTLLTFRRSPPSLPAALLRAPHTMPGTPCEMQAPGCRRGDAAAALPHPPGTGSQEPQACTRGAPRRGGGGGGQGCVDLLAGEGSTRVGTCVWPVARLRREQSAAPNPWTPVPDAPAPQGGTDPTSVGRSICQHSEQMGAALVVLTGHDAGWVKRLLGSSVTQYVTQHCPRPVVVVRHADLEEILAAEASK